MSVSALPTELVRDICSHLQLRDWCAFRITCKAVYIKSLEAFADQFFKSIGFILTRNSLCQLEELAAHDIFRKRVQELWITPSLFEGYYEMDLDSFRDATGSYKSKRSAHMIKTKYIAYQGLVAEHLSIVESDSLNNVLKKCVALFDNLTIIRLQHSTDEFFWGQSVNNNFRCIGWRAARRQLGFDPFALRARKPIHNVLKTRAKDHAVAFSALLEAVASSKRRIKKLDTCNDEHCALPPSEVTLKQTSQSLLSSLRQLEFLHLCTSICEIQPDDSMFRSLVDLLIMVAPSLKVLTFSQWDLNGALSPQYFDDLSQRINFTSIKELNLYWIEITFDTLKAFLHTARPTLRALSLESVNLRGALPPTDNHIGHQRDLRDCQEMIEESNCAWQQVLNFLGDEYSLRSICLKNLGYRGYRLDMHDNLSKLSGSLEPNFRSLHSFNAEKAGVSFKEWIFQLRPGPPRGTRGRIATLPGEDYSARWTTPAPL
ncbi:hypothetical protein PENANT_c003G08244 [Penicillium antarcticum]|uniref:F-box domain-containing protein n=1 Tax=Penicillium antarcticum TaxID=416450 RepID=A0A1V6QII0_9EURO|nr:uncharacterized protein N7508_005799 [Penicillium antarcticum]KAJ5306784.1 hypothetical protein N7508_005799 [Penicillium antarcticum]OQD89030.1 hypothetical protein PENANT_c003G08244 [Penicillium antarcticum]